MKILASILVAATVSVMGGCSHGASESTVVPRQVEQQTQSPNASLAQQKMCADQAKVAFDDFRKERTPKKVFSDRFVNHFDDKTSTCYVEISEMFSLDSGKTFTTSSFVSDAFEGRIYASYLWKSDKVKKYWEVPPIECSVKPRGQNEVSCHSEEEFNSVVLQNFGTE